MSNQHSYRSATTEMSRWIRDEIEFEKEYARSTRAAGIGARRIQEWLHYHGYKLRPDGHFGPVTEANLKAFQRDNGLPDHGRSDRRTFDALVAPMRSLLKRPPADGMSFNEAVLMHARRHLDAHPIEIGGQNMGMWVRLYMKGEEGPIQLWCAGFVSFIIKLASETIGDDVPLPRQVSCDHMARDAQDRDIFVGENDVDLASIPPGSLFMLRRRENDWYHVGIVASTDPANQRFMTIEGNANQQGSSNGVEVCSISRGLRNTDFVVFEPAAAPVVFNAAVTEVRRYFYDGPASYTYGSFFRHWGGWITAGHVVEQMDNAIPDFCSGDTRLRPDGLDAALIGCSLPSEAPPQLQEGQDVVIRAFPGGSAHAAERVGAVYIERPNGSSTSTKAWIVRIDDPEEPVVTGMSGGLAMDKATGRPVGILVTANSRAQIDADPEEDHSMDIVSLRDVYDAVASGNA